MIEITITITDDGVSKAVVHGHGGGNQGTDIVCAAVSAITETALAGLLHYDREGVQWKMRNGFISIQSLHPSDTSVKAIMTTLTLGLKQIEKEYPERVSLLVKDSGIADEA